MKVTIHPSRLQGSIMAPASKSSMQRALAAALLNKGTSVISNPSHSKDDMATRKIIEALGASVEEDRDTIIIRSEGVKPLTGEVNVGESGLGIRMLAPAIALSEHEITINGEGSLLRRPMDFFDEVFPQLGVKIRSNHGRLPITIQGPLQPKDIEIDGSLSSQFLTGLLMAYGAALNLSNGETPPGSEKKTLNEDSPSVSIKVHHLRSKLYIDLTLDVMKQFGMNMPENKNYAEFIFRRNTTPHLPPASCHYTVENDWSSGAFLLVAGAIAGPVTVRGLDLTSSQPDKAILDVLMKLGAGIAIEAKGIKVHPAEMNSFDFDATDCPDLFPPLVTLAAYCKGESTIKGISRLEHKESNRALTLQEEFGKMGVNIRLSSDAMTILGGHGVRGAIVHSRHDHRIAMACAVAALKAEGETTIEETGAVKKSYPDFFTDLKQLGAVIDQHYSLPGKG